MLVEEEVNKVEKNHSKIGLSFDLYASATFGSVLSLFALIMLLGFLVNLR